MSKTVLFKEVEVFDIFRLDGNLLIRYNKAVAKTVANCKVCNDNMLSQFGQWRRIEDDTTIELIQKEDFNLCQNEVIF